MEARGKIVWSLGAVVAVAVLAIAWLALGDAPNTEPPNLEVLLLTDKPASSERPLSSAESPGAVVSTPSHVPDSVDRQKTKEQWIRDLAGELIQRGDSSSLIAASRLMASNAPLFKGQDTNSAFSQRLFDLVARAADRSPSDPAVQWLAMTTCLNSVVVSVTCDADRYRDALQAIDPENALNWIGSLETATSLMDEDAQGKALDRMANAKRFEDYRTPVSDMVAQSIESARVSPPADIVSAEHRPLGDLIDIANRNIPHTPLSPVIKACNPSARKQLFAPCRRIGQTMGASNNLEVAQTGWMMAKAMESENSLAVRQVRELQRRLAWQMDQAVKVAMTRGQARDLLRSFTDRAALERFLIANSIPLEPPTNWVQP